MNGDYEAVFSGVAQGLGFLAVMSTISSIISSAVSIYSYIILSLALMPLFKKEGITGGYAFIPIYGTYLACKILWGNGLKMLLMLIPIVGLYFSIKFHLDVAKAYGKSTGFGVGLALLSPIFYSILVFKKEQPVGAMVGTAVAGNYSQSNMQNQPMQAQGYNQPRQGTMQQPMQNAQPNPFAPQQAQQQPMQNAQPSPFAPQQTQSVQQPNPFAPQQGSDNTNLW